MTEKMKFGKYIPDEEGFIPAGNYCRRFHFPNGYGADVAIGPHTYGGVQGLFELAVLKGDSITYKTPITNDVEGWLTKEDVAKLLAKIEALPPSGRLATLA